MGLCCETPPSQNKNPYKLGTVSVKMKKELSDLIKDQAVS